MRRRQIFASLVAKQNIEIAKPQKGACPKCGRIIPVGMFMHSKYCKGK